MSTLPREIALPIDQTNQGIVLVRTRQISFGKIFVHGFAVLVFVIAAFFAHELGHAVVALLLGGHVQMINVLGIEWYPKLTWMPQFGFGGFVSWTNPYNPIVPNLIVIAGSTSTLLIAFAAALALNFRCARGVLRTGLFVLSLYFLDSLIHIIPVLNTKYYWAPLETRAFAEAYYGFINLGVPGSLYINSVFIIIGIVFVLDLRALGRFAQASTPIRQSI